MTDLLVGIVVFWAGFVIGILYRKVCADEDRDEIARLRRQVALWRGKWSIEHGALCESQDRHQLTLEENGHE